ncbi:actin-binding ADF family protein [Aspergillus ruber CBS 135680]|uniref:Cofilin n=1 Tax=Aspergillus ruber (strain CBS 135680) TaxID=1388766 RepID=A0A017RZB6_ASPRC|nr:cofilin, actophorin [Aspergillus ruber CBS 135680]EYE90103.1 cofilin, actophorin [Aspergillus ruber CBS 135680]
MSIPSGVNVPNECIAAFKRLLYHRGTSRPTFVIYRISEDNTSVIVEESSSEKNYEAFLKKLTSAVDHEGNPAPRYAVYDVEYDLNDDGRRATVIFISWMPVETSTRFRMLYAATKEQLRRALDVKVSIHADDLLDIEWKAVLREASGGRARV